MINIIILFTSLIFGCGDPYNSSSSVQEDLLGNDYRLFKNTPVWELAQAVQNDNIKKIKEIVSKQDINLDYQEPRFGSTLLMLSIMNEQFKSFEALVEAGANVNVYDKYDGHSAIMYAAGVQTDTTHSEKYLSILLARGANPNDKEIGPRREGNSTRQTPLLVACSDAISFKSPLDKVKTLVEAGADVNYVNEFNNFPLLQALVQEHYDVVLYLLEKGADFNKILIDRSKFNAKGKKIYIGDYLREKLLPLDTKEYKQKMAIVEFLRKKGIEYKNIPIPDSIKEAIKERYPENWKEYLEKY